ncbi:helix-turn-helix domain-containing protein [Staphylococcus saprophyticus]|uniref:helix-turn-helix domain-containing protein n=1 Tax=Staphylococcus saprophyticus TaxID=29385 RepID=UPI00374E9AF3
MIIIRLDKILADRKVKLSELANEIDITIANLSNLKTGKVKAIRFSTLDAICKALDCQPADIIEYVDDNDI